MMISRLRVPGTGLTLQADTLLHITEEENESQRNNFFELWELELRERPWLQKTGF